MTQEHLIHVLNRSISLFQAPDGFRTSMDSVMLAAACPIQAGQTVLDLGCGVGSAGLCVLRRVENTTLVGVDIQSDHIELSLKNAKNNDMADRASFICADIRHELKINTFDHIICNPPYKRAGAHKHSPSPSKAQAMGHLEDSSNLQSWITRAWHHIKGQGSLTIVHEAEQADSIIHALYSENGRRRFGAVEIIPLYPKAATPAKRVLIRAYKHKKGGTILHPGIIMHEVDGSYTKEANDILRHMAPL